MKTKMFALSIHPLTLLFTLTAAFGVLVHDTQIDRATTVALAAPATFVGLAAVDTLTRSEHHVHVERASMKNHLATFQSSVPRLQPRGEDRPYLQTRKLTFTGGSDNYIWPSV